MTKTTASPDQQTRRTFVKTAAYVVPAILTLKARPAFAQLGSGQGNQGNQGNNGVGSQGNNGVGNGVDPQPKGNPPMNDGTGTGTGTPGNQGGPNK
jgi:hypothetical protein